MTNSSHTTTSTESRYADAASRSARGDADRSARGDAAGAWPLLFAAWGVALASTLGALFIGEVMGQAPCVLCWFQRAFMFPLAVILAPACYRSDGGVWRYALPLAVPGGLVAAFHSLQYLGLIPQEIEPCGTGPSCTGADMTILGAVPIPFLSVGAFAAIVALLLLLRRRFPA